MSNSILKRIICGLLAVSICLSNLETPFVGITRALEPGESQVEMAEEDTPAEEQPAEQPEQPEEQPGEELQEPEQPVEEEPEEIIPEAPEETLEVADPEEPATEEETPEESEETTEEVDPDETQGGSLGLAMPLNGAIDPLDEPGEEPTIKKTQLSGQIEFDETVDGVDWSSVVHHKQFPLTLQVTVTYNDSENNPVEAPIKLSDIPTNDWWYNFEHDGNGGGSFNIDNVPNKIKVDDEWYDITSYKLATVPSADTPYYKDREITVPVNNITWDGETKTGPISMTLKTETVTLQPTLVPVPTDSLTVSFDASFKNNNGASEYKPNEVKKLQITMSTSESVTLKVPVGLSYEFVQTPIAGYKLDSTYVTKVTKPNPEDKDNPIITETPSTGNATGRIEDGETLTITTTNYDQNKSLDFLVHWQDNNNSSRPDLPPSDSFALEYYNGENWVPVADHLRDLGIDNVPKYVESPTVNGKYTFDGLPAVDNEKRTLQYRVVPTDALKSVCTAKNYMVQEGTSRLDPSKEPDDHENPILQCITLVEKTEFTATIQWNDNNNTPGKRPIALGDLRLYRKTENGTYEQVKGPGVGYEPVNPVNNGNGTWSVNISDLPRYDSENNEYDYVLVNGTIDNEGQVYHNSPTNYLGYYNNGSGTYGNDTQLAHNKGKITFVYHEDETFSATKTWNDEYVDKSEGEKLAKRPTATVTLWRFVYDSASGIITPEAAIANNKAAPVVYRTTDKREIMLSYNLDSSKDSEVISFNRTRSGLEDLPADFTLPKFDGAGHQYIYFVRETMEGTNSDHYDVTYTTSSGGALNDGTVSNVRREKASVNIQKTWNNPGGLSSITGATVQLEVWAKQEDAGDDSYEKLTVYSDEQNSFNVLTGDALKAAQSTGAFAATNPSGEASYYVNIYDKDGNPYDMVNAEIREVVYLGEERIEPVDGIVTVNGVSYKVGTAYSGSVLLGDDVTKQFRYRQTNTVSATRDYTVTKKWNTSILDDEIASVEKIGYTLYRRSTKSMDTTTPEKVAGTFEIVNPNGGSRTWETVFENLPKYDAEGYEYYYYIAEEYVVLKDGTKKQPSEMTNAEGKGWSVDYYRGPAGASVTNYRSTTGGYGHFEVSKNWQDYGDVDSRGDVQFRVYKRSTLAQALLTAKGSHTDWTDNTMVSLDDLGLDSSTGYKEYTLTAGNNYTQTVSLKDLPGRGEYNNTFWYQYVVLEYKTLNNSNEESEKPTDTVAAKYPYAQLLSIAQNTNVNSRYSYTGTVENSTRMYRVEALFPNSGGDVVLNNTRTGTTSISAGKQWKDEGHEIERPAFGIRFQLYRDGELLGAKDEQGHLININNVLPNPITSDVRFNVVEGDISVTWEQDSKGQYIVVKNTEGHTTSNWSFTIENLPMFADNGTVYVYNMEEVMVPAGDDIHKVGYYQRKSDLPTEGGDDKTKIFSFQYENTISGTTQHVAYKIWKDAGSSASLRPDIYLTLWRYEKDAEGPIVHEKVTDLKDLIWTKEPTDPTEKAKDAVHGYDWKITATELPMFSSNGKEYVYYFTETMNKNGETVMGTYVSKNEKVEFNGESYDKLTNTITDNMVVEGQKTWTGLSLYSTATDDLPDPTITIYRTVNSSDDKTKHITSLQQKPGGGFYTKEEVEALERAKQIEKIGTTSLNPAKTDFKFPDKDTALYPGKVYEVEVKNEDGTTVTNEDGTTATVKMLPKFDPDGNRYTYLVREDILDNEIADTLYTKTSASGTLANSFRTDVNRRSITVTKHWDNRHLLDGADIVYPGVKYELYRYELGNEANTCQLLKTDTISAAKFKAADEGQATLTFDDLLIFSPTGVQYGYYIKEMSLDDTEKINGYEFRYEDEPYLSTPKASTDNHYYRLAGKTREFGTLDAAGVDVEALLSNDRCDILSVPADWDKPEQHPNTDVTVSNTNTYVDEGKLTLTGDKFWNDHSNQEGLRPDEITLILQRYAPSQAGQDNGISWNTVTLKLEGAVTDRANETAPWIEWANTDTDTWQYTIHNLEKYAPNGELFVYQVSEDAIDHYKNNGPVSKKSGETTDSAGNPVYTMNKLTNSLDATYKVRKNWRDGSNKYNLRPATVTIVLERKLEGESDASYQPIPTEGKWGTEQIEYSEDTNSPQYKDVFNGQNVVGVKLSKEQVVQYTAGNTWQYIFENLPACKKVSDEAGNVSYVNYVYRCREIQVGGTLVGTDEKAGAYTREYTDMNAEQTIVVNKLDSTSLVVDKVWLNDEDNAYDSRPTELTFKLQREAVDQYGHTVEKFKWADVSLANGDVYKFKLTAANDWKTTLLDLPVAQEFLNDDNTTTTVYKLRFRAVEIHKDDTDGDEETPPKIGTKPDGAQNYLDDTVYGDGNSDNHYYDSAESHNVSHIENKLVTDDKIKVTKQWYREAGAEQTATFDLYYKKRADVNNDKVAWVQLPKATKQLSSNTAQTLEWINLPKYDREGNELYYKVEEQPITGYATAMSSERVDWSGGGGSPTGLAAWFRGLYSSLVNLLSGDPEPYHNNYTFTNTELQNYTVNKTWQNESYGHKDGGNFTATFRLEKQIQGETTWTAVPDSEVTLSTASAKATLSNTWENLPKYDEDGNEITYRAVETHINGKAVSNDKTSDYIVTYKYDEGDDPDPAFAGVQTNATNRMVYGFVNLAKEAAYLAPEVTTTGGKLEGVKFNVYLQGQDDPEKDTPYISGITTDINGNLICNEDGTYGTERKYLISGSYTLREATPSAGFSAWANGIDFTVGTTGGDTDTGEHGTAWISTKTVSPLVPIGYGTKLTVEYKHSTAESHIYKDGCTPATNASEPAYNLESRGIITFTKTTGGDTVNVSNHADSVNNTFAANEPSGYFGVYLDPECTQLVAGMVPKRTNNEDEAVYVLKAQKKDGTSFVSADYEYNSDNIPYLRAYNGSEFTLLSGIYYIKEEVAPAGYQLDSTVRVAQIDYLMSMGGDGADLTDAYPNNKARIRILDTASETGTADYKWHNNPNVVTLYKLDQFGRQVNLGSSGYLELTITDPADATFPSGEATVRLYQDADKPATKTNVTDAFPVGYITYSPSAGTDATGAAIGAWTISDLLVSGWTYTLSEPDGIVPDDHIPAEDFVFKLNNNGVMVVTSTNTAQQKSYPLASDNAGFEGGNPSNFDNAYNPGAGSNITVLRDNSRYLKNVALEKWTAPDVKLENISFKLYKEVETDRWEPVLKNDEFLTTNNQGLIDLSVLTEMDTHGNYKYMNALTGSPLMYGLDIGKYKFVELEKGASDKYLLANDVIFTIATNSGSNHTNYDDYAKVTYETSDPHVTQETNSNTGKVENDPIPSKELLLTKVNSADNTEKLSGARFKLEYTSVTNGDSGSSDTVTQYGVTKDNGILYLANSDWSFKSPEAKLDISNKGTYTLTEIKAPDGYMTRTEGGTPVTMATFKVVESGRLATIDIAHGTWHSLVLNSPTAGKDSNEIEISLNMTVANEKTKVYVAKRNDIVGGTKTKDQTNLNGEALSGAMLEIYEGTNTTGEAVHSWPSTAGDYPIPDGTLKENTIYTLHEATPPTGYMAANDLYFYLSGTTSRGSEVVSKLYVWNGGGTPTSPSVGSWTDRNINTADGDYTLTMVDEAVIAPVDLQKVVKTFYGGSDYEVLPGAKFKVKAGITLLGTAVTNSEGYLVWESIEDSAYAQKLIYNADGKRVTDTEADKATVRGKTIILRKNDVAYTITETEAPAHAYMDGWSNTVKITDADYIAYKGNSKVYVDASENPAVRATHDETDKAPTGTDLVNEHFKTTFQLYKYDAEHPSINAEANNFDEIGLNGVKFTLYKGDSVDPEKVVGTYRTETNVAPDPDYMGLLRIEITEKGTYTLVETSTLTGYTEDTTPMVFTIVNSDHGQTVTYSKTAPNYTVQDETPDDNTGTYSMPNNRIHGKVTLIKQDTNSHERLNNVEYVLSRTSPTKNENTEGGLYFPQNPLTVTTGKSYSKLSTATAGPGTGESDIQVGTDVDGRLTINDLQWGTYTLVETVELNGYKLDSSVLSFTIDAENQDVKPKLDEVVKNPVTNTKNSITVQKTDPSGIQLEDASFKLFKVTESADTKTKGSIASFYTREDATSSTEKVNSFTAGNTTIYGLTKGMYLLEETVAPLGYELAKTVYFEIDAAGVVSNVKPCKVEGSVVTVAAVADDNVAEQVDTTSTIKVKDTPIVAKLNKHLKDDVPIQSRGNASFTITPVSDSKFSNGSTDSRTYASNSNTLNHELVGGCDYYIQETRAPNGYKVQAAMARIHVNTDGTITKVGAADFFADPVDTDGVAVMTFTDDPIELTLNKHGELNGVDTTLDGAVFTVTGNFVNTETGATASDTVNINTYAEFNTKLKGRLIQGKTYTVTETTPPNGFMVAEPFTFTVNEYGNISSFDGEGASAASGIGTTQLSIKDEPNTITFIKVDEKDAPLAGAKFTLTAEDNRVNAFVNITAENKPSDATTWTEKTIAWTSSTGGFTLTSHLIAGVHYKLSEQRMPNREAISTDLLFYIEANGTVVLDNGESITIPNNTGMKAVALVDTTVTIKNPTIKGKATLTKYFSENSTEALTPVKDDVHLLPGAVYELHRLLDENNDDVLPEEQLVKTTDANVYSTSGEKTRFTTDTNGKILITGLPEGQYQFVEVDAPLSYIYNWKPIAPFTISAGAAAHQTKDDVDPRVNAQIMLTKYAEDGVAKLGNVVFEVSYRATEAGSYTRIGTATTKADETDKGTFTFNVAIYPGEESSETGLRRGWYKLTEIRADDQMLNTVDGTKNTITFEIGNEVNGVYAIKNGDNGHSYDVDGSYINLNANGVVDTPIPKKTVTVKKTWTGDTEWPKTFRPGSVEVKLYRSYNDERPVAVPGVGTRTLNSGNGWTDNWDNLPAYVDVDMGGGVYKTFLYTYYVKEVTSDSILSLPDNFWYEVSDVAVDNYTTDTGKAESGVKDGDTTGKITNTLKGHNGPQELTIRKELGGGSDTDVFQVRVKLYDGEHPTVSIGNTGFYQDGYTLHTVGGSDETHTAEAATGWMTIKGGESITLSLPKGVYYEVEENTTAGIVTGSFSGYTYTPRYKNATGTVGDTELSEAIVRNVAHKFINITKLDGSTSLSGAEYKVEFTPSDADDYTPQISVSPTWDSLTGCKMVDDKLMQSDGTTPVDITRQGTYKIYETKAPDTTDGNTNNYITPTDNNGNPIVLATITVGSYDTMTISMPTETAANTLVDVETGENGTVAAMTVQNEKTRVRIGKTIDFAAPQAASADGHTDADEGAYLSGVTLGIYDNTNSLVDSTWVTNGSYHEFPLGLLKEGVTYTLKEVDTSVPNGYKKAADVNFQLAGTYTTTGSERLSRIVIEDSTGQNTSGTNYGDPGVIDGQLNMVDETIIAPVDLQKVLETEAGGTWKAKEGVEFEVKTHNNVVLGTAKTDAQGYLVWKEISNVKDSDEAYVIYDADGHRVTDDVATGSTKASVIGKTIILRENDGGYTFTETSAPIDTHNNGQHFDNRQVNLAAYEAYLTNPDVGSLYNSKTYLNIQNSSIVATRDSNTTYTDTTGLVVNDHYHATVNLTKYDSDSEANIAKIPETEFTLYRKTNTDEWEVYKKAYDGTTMTGAINTSGKFYTKSLGGDLSITIPEKGDYKLVETCTANGYKLNPANFFEFTLADTATGGAYAQGTNTTLEKDSNGVPNERLMGEATLTKLDAGTTEPLNGVVYELKRTDVPDGVSSYLLKNQTIEVVTGKTYTFTYTTGTWTWPATDNAVADKGKIILKGLNWGSYTLTEKVENSGYVENTQSWSFTIGKGDFSKDSLSSAEDGKQTNVPTVTHNNAKNEVTLYKTNRVDSDLGVEDTNLTDLKGAKFVVHEGLATGCTGCGELPEVQRVKFYTSRSETTTVTEVVSGDDGTVKIYGLPTDVEHLGTNPTGKKSYHLVEIEAPKGFILQTKPVDFYVERDGKVNGSAPATELVTMRDDAIKLYLHKVGESDDDLTGAVFKIEDICDGCTNHGKLADDSDSKTLTMGSDNTIMIPTLNKNTGHTGDKVTVIGRHKYRLTETKAPDGYECTAVVEFTVNVDGTATINSTTGGHAIDGGKCAMMETEHKANDKLKIANEYIGLSLTKVDANNPAETLEGVTYTLQPKAGSAFVESKAVVGGTLTAYDSATRTVMFKTDDTGQIIIPDGLLIHGNSYLLKETATISGYYLGAEAKDGVILHVQGDGTVKTKRLDAYEHNTISGVDSRPVYAVNGSDVRVDDDESTDTLQAVNRKSAKFTLTKQVEGNMGDLSGTYRITLTATEPDKPPVINSDGTREITQIIAPITIELKLGDTYDSETGTVTHSDSTTSSHSDWAFGQDALPVGAYIVIEEDPALDYEAKIDNTSDTGYNVYDSSKKCIKTVQLVSTAANISSITLTNKKELPIDVGVVVDNATPYAFVALMIPALWLVYRYQKKRKGGGY